MNKRKSITLDVIRSGAFTKNMFRVTFGGEGLKDLPPDQAGGYLKLRIPTRDPASKPIVRTYTIRNHDENLLDIDFALHGRDNAMGHATAWALSAQPRDRLEVGGPGPAKPLPSADGTFLLVGDMTALPAIGANLDALGAGARGHAVIEIQHEDDKQSFDLPAQFQIHWLINPHPGDNPTLLSDFVRKLTWSGELDYAWVACEFEAMRNLRTYLREEKSLDPDHLYISSYWKRGLVEDEHRSVKGEDARA